MCPPGFQKRLDLVHNEAAKFKSEPLCLAQAHIGSVQQLGLAEPVHVALKILLHLFLLSQLLEVAPRLRLLSLLGKLSWEFQQRVWNI